MQGDPPAVAGHVRVALDPLDRHRQDEANRIACAPDPPDRLVSAMLVGHRFGRVHTADEQLHIGGVDPERDP